MKFNWHRGLPFIPIELCVDGKRLAYEHALIDTGAGSSLFNINLLFENHLELKESNILCEMVGIGGAEQVFQRTVEYAYFPGCTIEAPTLPTVFGTRIRINAPIHSHKDDPIF